MSKKVKEAQCGHFCEIISLSARNARKRETLCTVRNTVGLLHPTIAATDLISSLELRYGRVDAKQYSSFFAFLSCSEFFQKYRIEIFFYIHGNLLDQLSTVFVREISIV